MGLSKVVKNARAKIGIGRSTQEEAIEKEAGVARAEVVESRAHKSVELEKYVTGLGLVVENLDIRYDDNKATIAGIAADKATREKVVLAVGNVEGVGRVDDQMRTKSPAEAAREAAEEAAAAAAAKAEAAKAAGTRFYTVVPGDSLSKISEEFYGDPLRYQEIFEANQPMLRDPERIYPGQVLRIPGGVGRGAERDMGEFK